MASTQQLTLKLGERDRATLEKLVEVLGRAPADNCSHGPLDLERLVHMLLEDVALAVHRPGSWEGANMLTVLASHGYGEAFNAPELIERRRAYWGGRDPYVGGGLEARLDPRGVVRDDDKGGS
jgi:hypothetical protein